VPGRHVGLTQWHVGVNRRSLSVQRRRDLASHDAIFVSIEISGLEITGLLASEIDASTGEVTLRLGQVLCDFAYAVRGKFDMHQ
jgi:hypothetical protein